MAVTKYVFGATFVLVALVAIGSAGDIDQSTAWLWAAGLGGLGLAGLVTSVAALVRVIGQRRARRAPTPNETLLG